MAGMADYWNAASKIGMDRFQQWQGAAKNLDLESKGVNFGELQDRLGSDPTQAASVLSDAIKGATGALGFLSPRMMDFIDQQYKNNLMMGFANQLTNPNAAQPTLKDFAYQTLGLLTGQQYKPSGQANTTSQKLVQAAQAAQITGYRPLPGGQPTYAYAVPGESLNGFIQRIGIPLATLQKLNPGTDLNAAFRQMENDSSGGMTLRLKTTDAPLEAVWGKATPAQYETVTNTTNTPGAWGASQGAGLGTVGLQPQQIAEAMSALLAKAAKGDDPVLAQLPDGVGQAMIAMGINNRYSPWYAALANKWRQMYSNQTEALANQNWWTGFDPNKFLPKRG